MLATEKSRGHVLTCGVFRTIAGLELRCGYSEDDLIRSPNRLAGAFSLGEAVRGSHQSFLAAAELRQLPQYPSGSTGLYVPSAKRTQPWNL
jgi:hypothetical protein